MLLTLLVLLPGYAYVSASVKVSFGCKQSNFRGKKGKNLSL